MSGNSIMDSSPENSVMGSIKLEIEANQEWSRELLSQLHDLKKRRHKRRQSRNQKRAFNKFGSMRMINSLTSHANPTSSLSLRCVNSSVKMLSVMVWVWPMPSRHSKSLVSDSMDQYWRSKFSESQKSGLKNLWIRWPPPSWFSLIKNQQPHLPS